MLLFYLSPDKDMIIQQNISLKPFNTFGIDANASDFVEVNTIDELLAIIGNFNLPERNLLIIGGGSNILLTRNFQGMVIRMNLKGIEVLKENDGHVWVKAMAGERWHDLVLFCVKYNWGGVENLSLIPGCVGAAPMQNIGAYGTELKDVFESLEAYDLETGSLCVFSHKGCRFGYRESIFKNEAKGKYIITSVTLKLNKHPVFNISYGAIKQTLEKMGVAELSVKAVSDAVIQIRQSKLPDPNVLGNAGSFFKNPEVPTATFLEVQKKFPGIVGFKTGEETTKVAAGWLIEQCGWKGKVVGNTGSHKEQALVLVNYGGATGKEIWGLALEIQKSVKEKFGIDIQPEVNII